MVLTARGAAVLADQAGVPDLVGDDGRQDGRVARLRGVDLDVLAAVPVPVIAPDGVPGARAAAQLRGVRGLLDGTVEQLQRQPVRFHPHHPLHPTDQIADLFRRALVIGRPERAAGQGDLAARRRHAELVPQPAHLALDPGLAPRADRTGRLGPPRPGRALRLLSRRGHVDPLPLFLPGSDRLARPRRHKSPACSDCEIHRPSLAFCGRAGMIASHGPVEQAHHAAQHRSDAGRRLAVSGRLRRGAPPLSVTG